jgi:hypothetical protein
MRPHAAAQKRSEAPQPCCCSVASDRAHHSCHTLLFCLDASVSPLVACGAEQDATLAAHTAQMPHHGRSRRGFRRARPPPALGPRRESSHRGASSARCILLGAGRARGQSVRAGLRPIRRGASSWSRMRSHPSRRSRRAPLLSSPPPPHHLPSPAWAVRQPQHAPDAAPLHASCSTSGCSQGFHWQKQRAAAALRHKDRRSR